uniref:Uncharacterized protein n=2 Tax=Chrysotila carterae TaxID=13221 RepID=A0A7S4B9H3_CHRCT
MVLSLSPPLACTASYPAARRPIYARPLNLPGGQISERTDQRQASKPSPSKFDEASEMALLHRLGIEVLHGDLGARFRQECSVNCMETAGGCKEVKPGRLQMLVPIKEFVQPARSRYPPNSSTTTAVAPVLDPFPPSPCTHAKRERPMIVPHHANSDASRICGIP